MSKIATLFCLIILSSVTLQAQKKDKKKEQKPIEKIMQFNELTHDFGDLQEGGKVSFDFIYKNKSRKPLILTNVQASCGCTVPEWSKEPLKRRKKGKIKVTYNTKGRPGVFNKRITVNTNQGVQHLHIKGVVKRAEKNK